MHFKKLTLCLMVSLLLNACSNKEDNKINQMKVKRIENQSFTINNVSPFDDNTIKTRIIAKYENQKPREWEENVTGVYTALNTREKVIALTLDACGGPGGSGYDSELIYYLRQKNIPATLFLNSRWIDSNYWTFMALSKIPLFEIENHGYLHKPLSAEGKSAWGIKGTEGIAAIVDEVLVNHRKIQSLTGQSPRFFRSGTAYYDEIGVKIVGELGEKAVNYNVLGDAGATFSAEQVKTALLSAKPGSIVLLHMNKPNGDTAEGVKAAIPGLIREGYRFVKLREFYLK